MIQVPLTPFEHYMMADDRPDYPMVSWMCANFTGTFDRHIFERALREALKRHPLLRSYILGSATDRRSKIFWIPAKNDWPHVDWADKGTPLNFPHSEVIDLHQEIGIRCFIRESQNKTQLFLQTHHACCDGMGMMGFFEDFLMAYAVFHPVTNEPINLRPIQVQVPLNRDKFKLSGIEQLMMMTHALKRVVSFFFNQFEPLSLPNPPPSTDKNCVQTFVYEGYRFSDSEIQALRQIAVRYRVTLNELLLASLFLALNQWNKCYGFGNGHPIRIAVPISLHHLAENPAAAPNLMSLVFLHRNQESFHSLYSLLEGIHHEMQSILKWKFGLTFLKVFRLLGKMKGGVAWMLRGERAYSSVIFSFLGEVLKYASLPRINDRIIVGNMILESLDGFPPLRPKTHVSFGAGIYAGRLGISMHYNHLLFQAHQARELLNMVVDQVRRSLDYSELER